MIEGKRILWNIVNDYRKLKLILKLYYETAPRVIAILVRRARDLFLQHQGTGPPAASVIN